MMVLLVLSFLAAVCPATEKPRIVVMTDIGGDPDDRQSMVRFLLYACDFEVEGWCTGFGHGHYKQTRPDLIHAAVNAYGKVLPSLRRHRKDYPACADLKNLIPDGHNGDPHTVGPDMDSEASDWIIRVLERDDPRPVWFSIWGGPRELAQALWKLEKTKSPEDLQALKRKVFVHSINDQDRTAGFRRTKTSIGMLSPRPQEGQECDISPVGLAWLPCPGAAGDRVDIFDGGGKQIYSRDAGADPVYCPDRVLPG